MKGYIAKSIITIAFLMLLLPGRASAEEGDGLRVDSNGVVTLTSDYAAKEGISSISFSVFVKSADAESVEFRFNGSSAKIQEFRYDKESQKLNIYIAGTDALLGTDSKSLAIGRIEVLDGSGNGVNAKVGISPGSLMYVDGGKLKWMEELESSGEVEINGANFTPDPEPTQAPPDSQPDQTPDSQPDRTPAPTPVPSAQPTRAPQIIWPVVPVTPPPKNTPTPSPSPDPTELPEEEESSEVPDSNSTSEPAASEPADSLIDGEKAEEKPEEETNWVVVIAIIAIVMFIAVAVMAVVVLKKKPQSDRADDNF